MGRSRRERNERSWPELLELLKERSFRRGRVVLASGKESDFFIDCKQAALTARGHRLVGELMLDALSGLAQSAEAVAGVALGGCSLASSVSLMSEVRGRPIPALYVRKQAKEHGSRRSIEGPHREGLRVVILEDVVTTGGSTMRAVESLRQAGCEVVGIVTLVDRLEGGLEFLRSQDLEVVSLFTRHDFIPAVETMDADILDETLAIE